MAKQIEKFWLFSVILFTLPSCTGQHDGSLDTNHSDTAESIGAEVIHDALRSPDDSLSRPDPGTGEATGDTDAGLGAETTAEGVAEEEVWDDCHYDCFGGFECKDGQIGEGIWAPIPCWVESSSDCFYHGCSYPCVSGQCGELELCADDEAAIASLVPAGATWQPGLVWHAGDVTAGHWSGYPDCLEGKCTWFARDSEQATVIELTVAGMPQSLLKPVDGTTHLWVAELSFADVEYLALLGTVVEDVTDVSFYFTKVNSYDGCEAGLQHGFSGAAVIAHADGKITTVAWRGGSSSTGHQWVISSN